MTFRLPQNHKPVMRVPLEGATCSTCKFFEVRNIDEGHCRSKYYKDFMHTSQLPYPADEMCSDWYEPLKELL